MTVASPPADHGKLHILMLDPFFQRPDQPGATRTFDLAKRFTQAGHRVSVLTTSAALKDDAVVADGLALTVVPVKARVRFGFPVPEQTVKTFTRSLLWRIWRFADVDAVFTTDQPLAALPTMMLYCALRGIPLVLEARTGPPPRPGSQTRLSTRLAIWLRRSLLRLAAGYSRQVVVLSRAMEEALTAHGIGVSKILVGGPGCDTNLFATQPGTSAAALTAYPHLAQRFLVVYAGAMDAGRGLEQILGIAAAVHAIAPDVTFALCGDGPSRGALEARALELGVLNKSVWFLDALPRGALPPLLGAATAVIVDGDGLAPRRSSGVFFEALAASRPVIVTSAGWQRDLIEGRGAGLGLPENDPAAAARELVDFLKDGDGLRRANQQAAALAAGRLNIDRIAGEIRAIIENNVAADPRRAVLHRRTLRRKRVFDILLSLAGLLILSPVMAGLALAVMVDMRGWFLFTQMRTGLKGRLFRIYKFRSMSHAKDSVGTLLPDEDRLSPFGRFLRRSSLDELPALFNVLMGDMSLVGPRPLLPEYLPFYTPEQRRRHDVAPGITGWSQVNGRNSLTWEEKFALDLWYVDHVSLWLDFKIMLRTLWVALSGRGVNAEGHATMPRFDEIMARRQGAEDV